MKRSSTSSASESVNDGPSRAHDISLTVGQGSSMGFRGDFSEIFVVSLKVEAGDYAKAVVWLRDAIMGSIFDAERYVS